MIRDVLSYHMKSDRLKERGNYVWLIKFRNPQLYPSTQSCVSMSAINTFLYKQKRLLPPLLILFMSLRFSE